MQNFRAEFELTSCEKATRFAIFPTKLVLHIILSIMCVGCMLLLNTQSNRHMLAMHEDVLYWMLPSSVEKKDGSETKLEFFLYTPQEIEDHLDHVFGIYYIIPNISSAYVEVASMHSEFVNSTDHNNNNIVASPSWEIINWLKKPPTPQHHDRNTVNDRQEREVIHGIIEDGTRWRDDILPNNGTILGMLDSLKSLSLTFYLRMWYVTAFEETFTASDRCSVWEVVFVYDYTYRAQLLVNVHFRPLPTLDDDEIVETTMLISTLTWLSTSMLILSIIYSLLLVKSIARAVFVIKRLHSTGIMTWSSFTWGQVRRLVNAWNILSLAANICVVVFSCSVLFTKTKQYPSLPGFAGALHILNFIQYLRYSTSNYFVISIIKVSVIPLVAVVIEVLPIFMGAAVFCTSTFGVHSDRFGFISTTIITLFALLNGDEMRDTMKDAAKSHESHAFFTILLLCTFVTFFTYVVISVFINVVERAFVHTLIDFKLRRTLDDNLIQALDALGSIPM